jgi:hypothetical protein
MNIFLQRVQEAMQRCSYKQLIVDADKDYIVVSIHGDKKGVIIWSLWSHYMVVKESLYGRYMESF